MTSVIDTIKGWRKPKKTVHAETIDMKPEFPTSEPSDMQTEFVPDMDFPDVFIDHLKDFSKNVTSGRWRLTLNVDDMIQCYDSARVLAVLAHAARPDDQFKLDMIKAEREPDYVEQAFAIYIACETLWDRRKLSIPEKPQIEDYEPDERRAYGRYYEDGDEDPEEA